MIATNTKLTRDIAICLIKRQDVLCPRCGKAVLRPRYTYTKQNVEYVCPACKEIYHPSKLI